MSKHTPGSWVWADNYNGLDGLNGEPVLRWEPYDGMWLNARDGREDGNARLIAAAPELLEALRDMYEGWKYIRRTHGDLYGVGWDRAQEKAEAALAKATGEQA
jgi:hypothetical protein